MADYDAHLAALGDRKTTTRSLSWWSSPQKWPGKSTATTRHWSARGRGPRTWSTACVHRWQLHTARDAGKDEGWADAADILCADAPLSKATPVLEAPTAFADSASSQTADGGGKRGRNKRLVGAMARAYHENVSIRRNLPLPEIAIL